MNTQTPARRAALAACFAGTAAFLILPLPSVHATVSFLGVAAGDATSTGATVWTRAVDLAAPAPTPLTLQVSPDPAFNGLSTLAGTTDAAKDYTLKLDLAGLDAATVYYYRFQGPAGELSGVGRFKTAPAPGTRAAVHFGFSGDMDGLMRPYALAATVPAQGFDFFVNVGDTIYENASNAAGNNAASYLNSPSVTLSGTVPAPTATGATRAQLFDDYAKKYREQILPVNAGGQNGLQPFYAAQCNYTLLDNHELGNRQYINGGAPAGGPVGDMPTGAGVDARQPANDVNTSGTFINKAPGFQILQDVYFDYQPITDRGVITAPADPRTDNTRRLYFSQPWGKNVVLFNLDDRSYRDIRVKTPANADDTGTRAANPGRTMLGATQLAWLEQALLDAQAAGTTWKVIVVSNPIDQVGPIGGALTGINNTSGNPAYGPVSADGGKSWMGGYRAERKRPAQIHRRPPDPQRRLPLRRRPPEPRQRANLLPHQPDRGPKLLRQGPLLLRDRLRPARRHRPRPVPQPRLQQSQGYLRQLLHRADQRRDRALRPPGLPRPARRDPRG